MAENQGFPSAVLKKLSSGIRGGQKQRRTLGKGQYDVVIAGGGVTGAAIGYGLARKGCRVAVLDAPPKVDRASRSNMGLIWCQSKALGRPEYVRWGFLSSKLFPELARELQDTSGIDIVLSTTGGIIPCLGEAEFNQRSQYLEDLRQEAGGEYPGTMLSREELEQMLPRITFGKEVVGGTFSDRDGFLEPLKLMFALRQGMKSLGGEFFNHCRVESIHPTTSGYRLDTTRGTVACDRLVLAGGLGNRQLAAPFGVKVPVTPDRGQVLLTERVGNILPIPILGITRTPGGTIMVGFMHENVGTDVGLVPESLAKEANWAARVWPDIANLRVIRCWSSLRVMPLDAYPVYDTLPGHPNCFLINAHSAVTLAAVHVETLPDYILGNPLPADPATFGLSRFN